MADIGEALAGLLAALFQILRFLLHLIFWLRIPILLVAECALCTVLLFQVTGYVPPFPSHVLYLMVGSTLGLGIYLIFWLWLFLRRREEPVIINDKEASIWLRYKAVSPMTGLQFFSFLLACTATFAAVNYGSDNYYIYINKSWSRMTPKVEGVPHTFLDFDKNPVYWKYAKSSPRLKKHIQQYHPIAYLKQFPYQAPQRSIVKGAKKWYKATKNIGKKAVGTGKTVWSIGRALWNRDKKKKKE